MKKTLTIHIGGMGFTIDDDAYATLEQYLDSIQNHFAKESDAEEITTDIEDRIAELLKGRYKNDECIITMKDVEFIIGEMGTIEDITGQGGEEQETPAPASEEKWQRGKKFMRDEENGIIGGVCSGLAAYFGIDVTIVRIVFVIATLLNGIGIVGYIILWVLVPQAKSASDKMHMHGKRATLSGIQQAASEKWNSESVQKDKTALLRFFDTIFAQLGKLAVAMKVFLKKALPIAVRVIGMLMMLITTLAFAAITAAVAAVAINMDNPLIHIPFDVSATLTSPGFVLLLLAYGVVIIPIIFLFALGLSLINKRSLSGRSIAVLMFLWIILASLTAGLGIRLFPLTMEEAAQYHEEHTVQQQYAVEQFDSIDMNRNYSMTVVPGDEYKVEIAGPDYIVDSLEPVVKNDTLTIQDNRFWKICFFCSDTKILMRVTVPELEHVSFGGATEVTIENVEWKKNSTVSLNGSAAVRIDPPFADKATITQTGASVLTLSGLGTDNSLTASLSGASQLFGSGFQASAVTLDTSVSSKAVIRVTDKLTAIATGASHIEYIGNPDMEVTEESGAATITQIEDLEDISIEKPE